MRWNRGLGGEHFNDYGTDVISQVFSIFFSYLIVCCRLSFVFVVVVLILSVTHSQYTARVFITINTNDVVHSTPLKPLVIR